MSSSRHSKIEMIECPGAFTKGEMEILMEDSTDDQDWMPSIVSIAKNPGTSESNAFMYVSMWKVSLWPESDSKYFPLVEYAYFKFLWENPYFCEDFKSIVDRAMRDNVISKRLVSKCLPTSQEYAIMTKESDDALAELDNLIDESEGEEVFHFQLEKYNLLVLAGKTQAAADQLLVVTDHAVTSRLKFQLYKYQILKGFSEMDLDVIYSSILQQFSVLNGRWEPFCELRIYYALYKLVIGRFHEASELLVDAVFDVNDGQQDNPVVDLISNGTLVLYTVLTSIISLDIIDFNESVMNNGFVASHITIIPYLRQYVMLFEKGLFRSQIFKYVLDGITAVMRLDPFMSLHWASYLQLVQNYVEMRCIDLGLPLQKDIFSSRATPSVDNHKMKEHMSLVQTEDTLLQELKGLEVERGRFCSHLAKAGKRFHFTEFSLPESFAVVPKNAVAIHHTNTGKPRPAGLDSKMSFKYFFKPVFVSQQANVTSYTAGNGGNSASASELLPNFLAMISVYAGLMTVGWVTVVSSAEKIKADFYAKNQVGLAFSSIAEGIALILLACIMGIRYCGGADAVGIPKPFIPWLKMIHYPIIFLCFLALVILVSELKVKNVWARVAIDFGWTAVFGIGILCWKLFTRKRSTGNLVIRQPGNNMCRNN